MVNITLIQLIITTCSFQYWNDISSSEAFSLGGIIRCSKKSVVLGSGLSVKYFSSYFEERDLYSYKESTETRTNRVIAICTPVFLHLRGEVPYLEIGLTPTFSNMGI